MSAPTTTITGANAAPTTCIIVDDEPHARQAMMRALKPYENLQIVAQCENGLEAVKAVHEHQPQLMFLDIQMPKLDGFDVLDLLGPQVPKVVFVTAYDEYAVKAFEANAIDYLLKPLDPARLKKCVGKITTQLTNFRSGEEAELTLSHDRETEEKESSSAILELVDKSSQTREKMQRILVREGSDVHVIPVAAIHYMESADDYVAIHTQDATHIKLDRLNKLEEKLNSFQFCRIHRSYLLNINYLARIESETKDSRIAILESGKQLPVSRNGYAVLRELL